MLKNMLITLVIHNLLKLKFQNYKGYKELILIAILN